LLGGWSDRLSQTSCSFWRWRALCRGAGGRLSSTYHPQFGVVHNIVTIYKNGTILYDVYFLFFSLIFLQVDLSPFNKRVKQVSSLFKVKLLLKSSFLKLDISYNIFAHFAT